MLRRFAAYRVFRIGLVAVPAILTYRWLLVRERLGRPASPDTWERVHDRTARGLHDLGIHLAGFFVKLCQIVGARADVFAAPFIRRLGRFHDAVPARPFREVRGWIERELGRRSTRVHARRRARSPQRRARSTAPCCDGTAWRSRCSESPARAHPLELRRRTSRAAPPPSTSAASRRDRRLVALSWTSCAGPSMSACRAASPATDRPLPHV
jgi:hypothetical protein